MHSKKSSSFDSFVQNSVHEHGTISDQLYTSNDWSEGTLAMV